ncbi:probable amino-acid acetyltransferase NAGS2, chloroplastic isoform X2 [Panicum virgatum]|uniref:probable amino-acid acetyltransferase NAGS2, chloroplastic isoform X2 n=1 Tax=Panicum virgatum TaxID=38727 RepID=UPI0019D56B25|nr:probable amino-acid acetyltransferase NAGS2, chloroplastic isoform X2 [Panicum virgatum]
MATWAPGGRLAGEISRPAARAAANGLPSGRLRRVAVTRRWRGHGVRCCAIGNSSSSGGGGAVDPGEEFVGFFREAWPYIRGHRGSTFVVVISSEVVSGPHFDRVLQDISLLHGLGIKFVLVPGTLVQIDKLLSERGKKAKYVGQYRITDSDSLEAAMEAAGRIRLTIEAKLSPGPPMLNLRRHGVIGRWHGLVDNIASGNFLGAKVVDEESINSRHKGVYEPSMGARTHVNGYTASFQNGLGFNNGNGIYSGEQGFAIGGEERLSRSNGYLSELAAAAYVCHGGVQRVHIIDGTVDGSLLLELFTRDGAGTMIARDVYEGTRMATAEDLLGIRKIIRPLEDSGVLVRRTDTELLEALNSFYVVERDGSIIACAALFPFPEDKSGEVAAIAVSEECRGRGQGDKLLDYVEKVALSLGLEKLFLLTTRTADWFVRRGFSECSIESIPEQRRKRINLSRGSKYYIKQLQPKHAGVTTNNFVIR